MTKLQKNAWVDLIAVAVCFIIGIPFIYAMKHRNTQGLEHLIIGVFVGSLVVLAGVLRWKKTEACFDEREKLINRKAFAWSTYVLTVYAVLLCFIPFFVIGAKGFIPIHYLPIFLFVGLFIAQLVQSAVILIQLAQEQADEQ